MLWQNGCFASTGALPLKTTEGKHRLNSLKNKQKHKLEIKKCISELAFVEFPRVKAVFMEVNKHQSQTCVCRCGSDPCDSEPLFDSLWDSGGQR